MTRSGYRRYILKRTFISLCVALFSLPPSVFIRPHPLPPPVTSFFASQVLLKPQEKGVGQRGEDVGSIFSTFLPLLLPLSAQKPSGIALKTLQTKDFSSMHTTLNYELFPKSENEYSQIMVPTVPNICIPTMINPAPRLYHVLSETMWDLNLRSNTMFHRFFRPVSIK